MFMGRQCLIPRKAGLAHWGPVKLGEKGACANADSLVAQRLVGQQLRKLRTYEEVIATGVTSLLGIMRRKVLCREAITEESRPPRPLTVGAGIVFAFIPPPNWERILDKSIRKFAPGMIILCA